MTYVLGLDLGTSALKGILANRSGEVVTDVSVTYPLYTPERGYSEQNPEDWYKASIEVIEKIIDKVPNAASSIEGISISGQMHSLVLLDESGEALRKAILWNDVRTTTQCKRITESLGDDLNRITKNKALEGFTLPKMLWVQDNEPGIWEKVAQFLLPKDYLRYRLTNTYNMDYSDAAGTLLLDVKNKKWSSKVLDIFGIDPSICPPLIESTKEAGFLKDTLAENLGITNRIPIFTGGADNACGAVGAGIMHSDQAMVSIGTSGVFLSFEETGEKDYKGNLHFFNHVVSDKYYSMGVTLAAGNSLNWFKDQFAPEESFEDLLSDIDKVSIGSNGLLFAPYISGERTPYTDSKIRGTFLGIDIKHTRNHFARAVIEGITLSLRDSQELMRKHSEKRFNQIVSVGGGAKNKEWLQMQADIFNTPVVTLATEQGPGMGAAMIAAVGAGWYPNLEACSEVFVQYKEPIYPNPKSVNDYNKVYDIYKEVYPTIRNISHRLSK